MQNVYFTTLFKKYKYLLKSGISEFKFDLKKKKKLIRKCKNIVYKISVCKFDLFVHRSIFQESNNRNECQYIVP